MNILNLIDQSKGNVYYTIIRFPDGEPHIFLDELDRKRDIKVICRITCPEDLFIVMQVGNILNRQGISFHLTISYLMSMRMDRVMSFNEAYSLEIVSNCINSINPSNVEIIEPHSYKTKSLIKKSVEISCIDMIYNEDCVICFPDKGANTRYSHLFPQKITLYGSKIRDVITGRLSEFKIENPEDYQSGAILVIDDLCDGGGTFVGIANEIRKFAPDAKLKIFVTHMVNKNGITALSKNYDEVLFTDSFFDWNTIELPKNVKCKPIF